MFGSDGYIELPEDSERFFAIDDKQLVESEGKSFMERFQSKLKRVRSLDLSKLKRSNSCRFYCQPAVENRDSGVGDSLRSGKPNVRIMINHCLRCLRRKGHMEKIMERKLFERGMLATPSNEITLPSSHSKTQTATTSKQMPYHILFGGWISFNNDSNQDSDREWRSSKMQGLRKLLWKPNKPGKFAATKRPIVIGDRDNEDYVNNYEDVPKGFSMDFGKLEDKSRDLVPQIFIGAFIFFGMIFIIIFPCLNFVNMCFDNFRTNVSICCYILFCLDPKYKLVKEMCQQQDIYIPKYLKYKKLMRKYRKASRKKEKMDKKKAEDAKTSTPEKA
ncbi:uncharacterized protein CDAR_116911 [Caerostris darwini]|uniref:Uncharacterized protein n=1 Tax=Caerostris darwini TaxID=1538125 RepID=A0AAV4WAV2_9ARAC|nr:uncharacterized protein CDAR_116911 [Caerostris darwini]